MRIFVVGGNGLVGGHIALRLAAAGHHVTIGSRSPVAYGTPLASIDWQRVDYLTDAQPELFKGFDALVFTAGQDPRHVPPDADPATHYRKANGERIATFFNAAKQGGVRRAILVGSYYPQAAPELLHTNPYVASRLAADEGVRALKSCDFHVVVLNAPFIIGEVTGLSVPSASAMAHWALGHMELPRTAPPGGTNVISCNSLSDAIEGALVRGRNGHAYLLGDENMTFANYLNAFFMAAGDNGGLAVVDAPHVLIPDSAILRGRGTTIWYDVDPVERLELGYRQADVIPTIELIVTNVREAML